MSRRGDILDSIYHIPCCGVNDSLQRNCKDSLDLIQRLTLLNKLPVHKGCVNTIKWNSTGSCLLSGSDDRFLNITDPFKKKVLWRHKTPHRANIFSAKFLPDATDSQIVSCSGDGMVLHTDVNDPLTTNKDQFHCHFGAVYDVETSISDPSCFITCGDDGTIRWIDLRTQSYCLRKRCKENILMTFNCGVTALTCNKLKPYQIAIGNGDSIMRIMDRRYIKQPAGKLVK